MAILTSIPPDIQNGNALDGRRIRDTIETAIAANNTANQAFRLTQPPDNSQANIVGVARVEVAPDGRLRFRELKGIQGEKGDPGLAFALMGRPGGSGIWTVSELPDPTTVSEGYGFVVIDNTSTTGYCLYFVGRNSTTWSIIENWGGILGPQGDTTAADASAQAAANSASQAATSAANAQNAANAAISNSDNAVATANTALSNSETAISTANTALANSQQAVDTSNTAFNQSTTALSNSETATNTANTALANSEEAIDTANEAEIKIDTAINQFQTIIDGELQAAFGNVRELDVTFDRWVGEAAPFTTFFPQSEHLVGSRIVAFALPFGENGLDHMSDTISYDNGNITLSANIRWEGKLRVFGGVTEMEDAIARSSIEVVANNLAEETQTRQSADTTLQGNIDAKHLQGNRQYRQKHRQGNLKLKRR